MKIRFTIILLVIFVNTQVFSQENIVESIETLNTDLGQPPTNNTKDLNIHSGEKHKGKILISNEYFTADQLSSPIYIENSAFICSLDGNQYHVIRQFKQEDAGWKKIDFAFQTQPRDWFYTGTVKGSNEEMLKRLKNIKNRARKKTYANDQTKQTSKCHEQYKKLNSLEGKGIPPEIVHGQQRVGGNYCRSVVAKAKAKVAFIRSYTEEKSRIFTKEELNKAIKYYSVVVLDCAKKTRMGGDSSSIIYGQ